MDDVLYCCAVMGLPLSYPMRLAITPCTHLLVLRETRQISGFSEVKPAAVSMNPRNRSGCLLKSKRDLRPTGAESGSAT